MTTQGAFVFFDLGGTLVDMRWLVRAMFRSVGIAFPELRGKSDQIAASWLAQTTAGILQVKRGEFLSAEAIATQVLQRLVSSRGNAVRYEVANEVVRSGYQRFVDTAKFCPDVSLVWLSRMRRLASGLGIITDGDIEPTSRLMERLGMASLFQSVTTSEAVGAYKPDSDVFQTALREAHAVPSQSLFVSDSPLDLEGAFHAGIASAIVRRPRSPGHGSLPDGTLLLRNLGDLGGILLAYRETGRFAEA